MENQLRSLYILFSRQNTRIGRFIRIFLRDSRYSHVAVSLDEGLNEVYSFSRKRHDSPFSGGLVREYPEHYLYGGRDVPVKLMKIDFSPEEYGALMQKLSRCIDRREDMLYNLYDAFVLPLHRRYHLSDAYTCVDFAAYLLGVNGENADIGSLEKRLDDRCIYEGGLKALLERSGAKPPQDDEYFVRKGLLAATRDLFTLIRRLNKRRLSDKERVRG